MRTAKKLCNTTQYNNVYVNPDLSYQERQFQKGLRQELVRRKSTGKKGIVIHNGQIMKLVQHDTPTTGNPPPIDRINTVDLIVHHTNLPDVPSFSLVIWRN